MASFFNMKGTTQPSFMIGVKGPILTKYVAQKDGSTTTYLQLPENVIGTTIYFDTGATKYINGTEYTGNAATATKLSAAHIGLHINGLEVSHVKGDGGADSGLSDGSGLIYGSLISIDSQYLIKGENGGLKYSVLEDLVQGGDLNGFETASKLASAIHTHSQYLATGADGLKLTTKNGDTALGQLKIDADAESVTTTSDAPQTIKLNLKLRDKTIVAGNIADKTITSGQIGDGEIKAINIADENISSSHMKPIDSVYLGDFTGKIGKVDSANDVNIGGNIAGVAISNILVHENDVYSSKVQSALQADKSLEVYDTTASAGTTSTATAKQIIAAVNKVSAASASKSVGNLVLWTEDGITGTLKGNVTGNADTATKLASTSILWGNEFTGENGQKLGSENSAAANISYTGHITPKTSDSVSIGSADLKYKNLYLTNTAYLANMTATGTITTKKIIISGDANATDTDTGIDMNGAYSIRNANYITSKEFLPVKGQNSTLGNEQNKFYAAYFADTNRIYLGNNGVTLKGELDAKAAYNHVHDISSLTGTQQTVESNGQQIPVTYINNIALSGHKHSISDITDFTGIYRFKGTVANVTNDSTTGALIVSSVSNPENGDVYNVTDPNGFNLDGKHYSAGTNIVYEKDIPIENTNPVQYTGIWKPLGGTFNIDLDQVITELQTMKANHLNSGETQADTGANISYHSANNNTTQQDALIWQDLNGTAKSNVLAANIRLMAYYGQKLDGNKFKPISIDLPRATADTYGLIRTGYITNNGARMYAVNLNNDGQAYVNVPWTDYNDVDRYALVTNIVESANNSSALINHGGAYPDNGFYLRLIHDNLFRKVVEKSIKIIGAGDATVKFKPSSSLEGTMEINVPKRSGYSIPLIKCMEDGEAETGTCSGEDYTSPGMIFSAEPTSNGSGIFSDDGNIKNGSLVLLYIDKVYNMYNADHYTNGIVPVKIKIPKKIFNNEFPYYGDDSYLFPVITKTRKSTKMYFPDLSKKLFLCQLVLNNANNEIPDNVDTELDNGRYILILDDVNDSFNQLREPIVYLKSGLFKMSHLSLSNALINIMRQYNGIADIILRTNSLGVRGEYEPIYDLDVNLSKLLIDENNENINVRSFAKVGRQELDNGMTILDHEQLFQQELILYSRQKLISNVAYDNINEEDELITKNTLSYNIKFKKDRYDMHSIGYTADYDCTRIKQKINTGLRKSNGNINLNKLQLINEQQTFLRDYTKIKFQFILHFKNSYIYDLVGGISGDEFTLTKSKKMNRGFWGVIIHRNSGGC